MPNPIAIIKEDHRNVEDLFEEYESFDEYELEEKQDVIIRITDAITLHTSMEEEILYPRLQEYFRGEGNKLVEEAYAEHGVIKQLVEEIKLLVPEDPQCDAKMKVLKENLVYHIEEEEGKILPRMEDILTEEDITALGEELESYKIENE